jgi:hypothetical protein
VKTIPPPPVPTAEREPLVVSVRKVEFSCTVTPGSIVNVTPDETVDFPINRETNTATAATWCACDQQERVSSRAVRWR